MFNKIFADDWIRTTNVWYQKRQLFQLSHNHCPVFNLLGKMLRNQIELAVLISKAIFCLDSILYFYQNPSSNND